MKEQFLIDFLQCQAYQTFRTIVLKPEVALAPILNRSDFSFWARSKNPQEFEIPRIGIGHLESPKLPSKKSPMGWGFGIFEAEKSRDISFDSRQIPVTITKSPEFVSRALWIFWEWNFLGMEFFGNRDFSRMGIFFRGMGFFREMGYKKLPILLRPVWPD